MGFLYRSLLCLALGFMEVTAAQTQTAIVGDNALLSCKVKDPPAVFQWRKDGLDAEYVFFFRDGSSSESNHHASYRGRVKLQDEKRTDGNLSIFLSNVTLSDAGTYRCVIPPDTEKTTIILEVKEKETDNQLGLKVGLPLGLLAFAALCIGGFVWYRQGKSSSLL